MTNKNSPKNKINFRLTGESLSFLLGIAVTIPLLSWFSLVIGVLTNTILAIVSLCIFYLILLIYIYKSIKKASTKYSIWLWLLVILAIWEMFDLYRYLQLH